MREVEGIVFDPVATKWKHVVGVREGGTNPLDIRAVIGSSYHCCMLEMALVSAEDKDTAMANLRMITIMESALVRGSVPVNAVSKASYQYLNVSPYDGTLEPSRVVNAEKAVSI